VLRFALIRFLQAVPVLLAIYAVTFLMIKAAPGGPFDAERAIDPSIVEAQRAYYGYDDPLPVQFVRLLVQHLTLDLPPLASSPGLTSADIIRQAFPVSAELGLWSLVIALSLGIPAGALAAARQNTLTDRLATGFAMTGICLPTFVIGPLLALVFAIWLGLLDVSGWFDWKDRILPAFSLGLFYAAYIARLTRAGALEALGMDYVRSARAKGLSEWRVVGKHALRAASCRLSPISGRPWPASSAAPSSSKPSSRCRAWAGTSSRPPSTAITPSSCPRYCFTRCSSSGRTWPSISPTSV